MLGRRGQPPTTDGTRMQSCRVQASGRDSTVDIMLIRRTQVPFRSAVADRGDTSASEDADFCAKACGSTTTDLAAAGGSDRATCT
jgi:hypothetical protein